MSNYLEFLKMLYGIDEYRRVLNTSKAYDIEDHVGRGNERLKEFLREIDQYLKSCGKYGFLDLLPRIYEHTPRIYKYVKMLIDKNAIKKLEDFFIYLTGHVISHNRARSVKIDERYVDDLLAICNRYLEKNLRREKYEKEPEEMLSYFI